LGGLFIPDDLATYAGQMVLLMWDKKGAESELLDPQASPALKGMDKVVESHECVIAGITQVKDDGQRQLHKPPNWFVNLAHLDQLLATWEWRSGPTPWLVMKTR
jgi:hypothetical protein